MVVLQKDLPDWLLCYSCSLFHPVKANGGPRDMWHYEDEPTCVQESGYLYPTIDFNPRYQHVQLLMNRYRFGRSYTKHLQALSHNFSRSYHDSKLEGTIWGEIVAGQLLLRFNQRLCLLAPASVRCIQDRLRPICPHLEWFGKDPSLWDTIGCRLSHAKNSPCGECSMPKSCRECSTWFLLAYESSKARRKNF